MWIEHSDYALPGRGDPIEIRRFYNSIIQETGLFGFGWSTKYDESLVFYDDKMIGYHQSDGRAIYFGRFETTDSFFSFSRNFAAELAPNVDGTYTLTAKDGSSRQFASNGKLISISDRNSNETVLTYNVGGQLIAVTDSAGRVLTLVPNSNGTIAEISDAMGMIAAYEYYPSTTLLKTVTFPDDSQYKFEYATIGTKTVLTTVKDALDNVLEHHAYDSEARATTSEKDGGVEKYTVEYLVPGGDETDPLGHTRVTDALGRITSYYHYRKYGTGLVSKIEGNCSSCGGGTESKEYFYDTSNSWLNLVKEIDALGRETLYTYDDDRNVTQQVDPFGTQKWTYNNFGQVLTYKDRVDSQDPDPNVNNAVLTYDSNGNLTTATDALGNVTTIDYPDTNNKGLPDSIEDARNNVTKFKWFANSGLLEEIEDPYAKKTKFTYDARGRTKTVTNALNHVTQYNYFDDVQRTVEMIYPNSDKITYKYDIRRLLESVTDERGKITSYEFDPAYRLKKITDPLGHFKEFGYDLMSNMTLYKDPLGNITDYVPDAFDRLKEVVYPAPVSGGTRLKEKFEYDQVGRIKKYFDTADRLTEYSYDDVTRTNTVTNPELEVTTIKYNQRFQTIEVKDALDQVYTFGHDPLGRVLSQTRAGGTMTFEYDEVGNPKKRIDYQGRETKYTYDNLNRLTEIEYLPTTKYPAPQTPNLKSSYGYDDISRLTSATNSIGAVTFAYDNRNRVISTTDVFGTTLGYEFELSPTVNQKRLKVGGALYATYNYDDANRLINIVDAGDSTQIVYGYDDADRPISRIYPNGATTTYEYDGMSRLKRLKDDGPGGTLFDRQYSYNTGNQISQVAELLGTKTFGYDNADRLTSVTDAVNGNESYAFDDVGNRTSSHLSTTYTLEPFNKLMGSETATFGYDPNGNMVWKSEGSKRWAYFWDYENRLTAVSDRKTRQRHVYDALGRRVQTYGGPMGSVKFTYDGSDVVMDDSSVSGITKYQNAPGIDNKLSLRNGASVSYFLADHLGSTVGLADATGAVTAQTGYDSFGNATNAGLPTRYQYTGREYDSFTGLHYYRARWYDAKLGRFISEDPIGFGGGDVNLYGYVRNQPYIFRDPLGLYPGIDVVHPGIWGPAGPGLAAAGGAFLSAAGATAAAPVVVAVGGFGAGVAIGYYPGQWSANHPSNPFVNGPWNPFGNPRPLIPAFPGVPRAIPQTSGPACQPLPRVVPISRVDAMPMPTPDREGCAEEISACVQLCAQAQYDPNMRTIWGGSREACLRGCISERCKKGFRF